MSDAVNVPPTGTVTGPDPEIIPVHDESPPNDFAPAPVNVPVMLAWPVVTLRPAPVAVTVPARLTPPAPVIVAPPTVVSVRRGSRPPPP